MSITMDSARRTSKLSDGSKTERPLLLIDADLHCDMPLVARNPRFGQTSPGSVLSGCIEVDASVTR